MMSLMLKRTPKNETSKKLENVGKVASHEVASC